MQAHLYVSGFVQGVGYRQFVKQNARKLGLIGWVKNLPDRKVEALIQGPKEKVEELIKLCEKGPFLAEVEDVDIIWEEEKENFTSFDITV